jgi:hypothetical protein
VKGNNSFAIVLRRIGGLGSAIGERTAFPVELCIQIFHITLQFMQDGASRNSKPFGNGLMGRPVKPRGHEYRTRPMGQFADRPFNDLKLELCL